MKRVLLVADRLQPTTWAWGHMANGIAKYAPPEYDCQVVDQSMLAESLRENPECLADFDGVCHFSWSESIPRGALKIKRLTTLLASHGFEKQFPPLDPEDVPSTIATALRNSQRFVSKVHDFDAFLCVSQRIYRAAEHYTSKIHRVVPGFDHQVFKPMPLPNGEKLRVGWCGQKPEEGRNNTKGYREVLLPLMNRMNGKVEFVINDRSAENALTQAEMVEWYRGIDVILSTSCSEGFQMPLLEAAACGRPVVATDVGGAWELGPWLLSAWRNEVEALVTVDQFERLLCSAAESRASVRYSSGLIAEISNIFTWERQAPKWLEVIAP